MLLFLGGKLASCWWIWLVEGKFESDWQCKLGVSFFFFFFSIFFLFRAEKRTWSWWLWKDTLALSCQEEGKTSTIVAAMVGAFRWVYLGFV